MTPYDHIKRAKDCHWWVFPPKLDKKTILDTVSGSQLLETCELKLGELLERQKEIKRTFKENVGYIKSVAQKENWDSFSLYFWLYFESVKATELTYIKRWIYYWFKIADAVQVDMNKPSLFEKKEGGITDEDIERAKEYPITELYEGDLKQNYRRFVGLCPFHGEKTPSFTIFENNHYKCFGGCGSYGDSIDFYMKKNGVDFIAAVKALCSFSS